MSWMWFWNSFQIWWGYVARNDSPSAPNEFWSSHKSEFIKWRVAYAGRGTGVHVQKIAQAINIWGVKYQVNTGKYHHIYSSLWFAPETLWYIIFLGHTYKVLTKGGPWCTKTINIHVNFKKQVFTRRYKWNSIGGSTFSVNWQEWGLRFQLHNNIEAPSTILVLCTLLEYARKYRYLYKISQYIASLILHRCSEEFSNRPKTNRLHHWVLRIWPANSKHFAEVALYLLNRCVYRDCYYVLLYKMDNYVLIIVVMTWNMSSWGIL